MQRDTGQGRPTALQLPSWYLLLCVTDLDLASGSAFKNKTLIVFHSPVSNNAVNRVMQNVVAFPRVVSSTLLTMNLVINTRV